MESQELILMLSAAALMLLLAVISRRRAASARRRVERVKRDAETEDLGGNSYFMPLPPIEQAVELDDAVEINSLLSGEPDSIAALARLQLSQTTDAGIATRRDLAFSLATPNPPAAPVAAPLAQRHPDPIVAPPPAPPAPPVAAPLAQHPTDPLIAATTTTTYQPDAATEAAFASGPGPVAAPAPAIEDLNDVPVRELVLTWFEARGYRSAALPEDAQPIELLLRHSTTPDRAYAFMMVRDGLTAQRVSSLFTLARASGFKRLLIASGVHAEPELVQKVRAQGVKIFDAARMRGELEKIDINIAAKIIAVARGRAAKRAAAATGGARTSTQDIATAH